MAQHTTHPHGEAPSGIWQVIGASSVGTLIEWYDFYIFGSLATIISTQFFPKDNPTAAFLATLATFAAGFIVRPFGALVFGRLGDLVGRKYTFLVTLLIMGLSTFLIGLIPSYETIGAAAPIIVLLLRLLQGLALGGEYGGAATYVAEHSPANQRGFYTSFIQTTATLGLFVSIGVILSVKNSMEVKDFESWGWRIPFLVSIFLVGISVYIRLKMSESPLFTKIKEEGTISKNPLKESFGKRENMKMVLLALFGAVAGQGVVWYTGQFYAMTFLEKMCNLDFDQTRYIIGIALLLATPFFIVFASLSDKIGRKGIMMAGLLLAILCYMPIYKSIYSTTHTQEITDMIKANDSAIATTVTAEAGKGEPTMVNGVAVMDSTITTVKTVALADGTTYKETAKLTKPAVAVAGSEPKPIVKKATVVPSGAFWWLVFLVFIQVIFVTMVYGPIAAFLVELFPTRIRYTSMSLPYHIGNGVFGGLTPSIATLLSTAFGPFAGLWYPIGVATLTLIIGVLYLRDGVDENIAD